jgi:phage-related protein
MKKITSIFYANHNNIKPVRDWLLSLSKEDRKRIGEDIINLNGFIKKDQKTPKSEIDLAIKRKKSIR